MGGEGERKGDSEDPVERTAQRAAETIGGETAAADEAVREEAQGFASDLRDAARNLMDEQKARMADLAQGFAHALRRSADAFAEEGGTVVARVAGRVADQVDDLSETVRNHDWRDMRTRIETAARRRPELFLAGAVAAGFFVGRVLSGPGGLREAAEP